mgnify:FL=1
MIENQDVEFKKIWKDEWLEWICGFANTTGGLLYIGVDDKGKVVGLGNTAQNLLDKLPGKIKDSLGILTEVKLEKENDLEYISIKIDKYPIPISYHGKFYLRSGRSNHEATSSEYDRLLLERFGKTWDDMQVPNVNVEELDSNAIERFKKLAVENKRLSPDEVKIDNKGLLENLKLYDDGHLTTSTILLFHNDPEKWIPGAYTRIAFFGKDDADLRYQDEVHGSLMFQAEEIVRILYAKYLKAYVSFNGMQRVDEYIIPETAAREIIYNFLQHKAYNIAIPTQIKVYEDHLYFWNPGEIPNEVKDILFKSHPSMPRNLKISQTFFRAGFVEYWGSGIKRITDACKEYGSPIPEIINEAGGVAVKCRASDSYLKAMRGENNFTAQTSPKLRPNFAQTINESVENGIIELIKENSKITQVEMAKILGVSRDQIKRNIKKLKDDNKIDRIGNRNNGYWKVLF